MEPDLQVNVQNRQFALAGNRVVRNTYALLALTLIPTIFGAFVGINMSFSFMRASPIMSSLLFLAVVYGMFFAIEKNKDSGVGVVLLLGLTFFLGLMLGPLLQYALHLKNGAQLIGIAAGGTAAVFFGLAAIATTTKRDLGFMTSFLTAGAIVLMITMVANIFMQIPALQLVVCAGFVLFSSGVILYQVNSLVRGGETNYVSATLTLYIAIYNLFTSLLQLLMAFTGQRD
jgi:modulator of FtsH protease